MTSETSTSRKQPRKLLSHLEQLVMNVVWERSRATTEQIREAVGISHPIKDSTVRTISSRLEAKGYLTHSLEGRTNVYRVIESRHQAAARAVRQIIDRYCGGSVEQLLTGMVEDEVIDQAELQLLARRIAQSKSKSGGKS